MGGAASTLELACEESNEEQVKRMIELKMDVNAPSGKKRFTPLHIASSKGNLPIVEALIAAGAALNPVCSNGGTPIFYAAVGNKLEVAKFLLANKADLRIQNKRGSSPLHIAAAYDHLEMVEMLLAAGADYTLTDSRNENPLHIATRCNFLPIVECLLEAGAKPDLLLCEEKENSEELQSQNKKVFDANESMLKTVSMNDWESES